MEKRSEGKVIKERKGVSWTLPPSQGTMNTLCYTLLFQFVLYCDLKPLSSWEQELTGEEQGRRLERDGDELAAAGGQETDRW